MIRILSAGRGLHWGRRGGGLSVRTPHSARRCAGSRQPLRGLLPVALRARLEHYFSAGTLALAAGLAAGGAALAQETEVKWTEIYSGTREIALGEAYDLDYGDPKAEIDFQFQQRGDGYYWVPRIWSPGRGTSLALVGVADFAKLDLNTTYDLPRKMEATYLCGGSAAAVPPGTILFATTSDSHFVKVFVESCGPVLRLRFTTYDRKVVPVKPATAGLDAPVPKSPPEGVAFEHDPRDLVLAWSAVSGAASYTLELDCRGCCGPRWDAFCGDQEKGKVFLTMTDLKTPAYYTLWNGAYAGRWRACAKGADGKAGPWSPWWNFSFKK